MMDLIDCATAPINMADEWNYSKNKEFSMHTIHAYPAKFPSFIATKAFDYAQQEGVHVESVADIFCGCGTVALEAKLHGKNFWGCDINPVATLIARVKSMTYDIDEIKKYYHILARVYEMNEMNHQDYLSANPRLSYWFKENSYLDLLKLKESIELTIPQGIYRDAFFCLFSSILKSASQWLTKSIKPQIDPQKQEINVWQAFQHRYEKFLSAVIEISGFSKETVDVIIETDNFLEIERYQNVDLIISSPPYVTSYEYADLHQLSTLFLEYTSDYRDFRKGSIGSVYNSEGVILDLALLNKSGQTVVSQLMEKEKASSKVRSVARYYTDIQRTIRRCAEMLNPHGMVFYIVGDTEYKGVKVKNSEHLIQCLIDEGFSDIKAAKRKISNKILTPYRNEFGRFSSNKTDRAVYHEEFVISGRM